MKFNVVIGNPPYQENNEDNNRDNPIYHNFYELSEKISEKYCLITPARFLFGVGQTPKQWNKKMLEDKHLKVVYFKQKSSEVFPNTDIKGGVSVLYRDRSKNLGPIDTFTNFDVLNKIMFKVEHSSNFESLNKILFVRSSYKFTNLLISENPYLKGRVKSNEELSMGSNVFDRYPEVFFDEKIENSDIKIYGRQNNKRVYKYIKSSYLNTVPNLNKWKVFVAKSNGTGTLGEPLSEPVTAPPFSGHTQTFISFGCFENEQESDALVKYLKTKFTRVLLGIKKITQDNATKETWSKVPMQDFSISSDIDWNKSIDLIDAQLYRKYKLSDDEIDFIESKAKNME